MLDHRTTGLTPAEREPPLFLAVGGEGRRNRASSPRGRGPGRRLARRGSAPTCWPPRRARSMLGRRNAVARSCASIIPGHGESDGRFENGTILTLAGGQPRGHRDAPPPARQVRSWSASSMGGWLGPSRRPRAGGGRHAGVRAGAARAGPRFHRTAAPTGARRGGAPRDRGHGGAHAPFAIWSAGADHPARFWRMARHHLLLEGIVRTHAPVHNPAGHGRPRRALAYCHDARRAPRGRCRPCSP